MALYRRKKRRADGTIVTLPTWWIGLRRRDEPRLRVSTGTRNKAVAQALERTFVSLVDAGRRDLVEQIQTGRLALPDVHDLYHRDREGLEQKSQRFASPELGPLVDEWLEWLAQPEALSPKTKAPYSRTTIRRYEVSWARIFAAAPEGRALPLKGLTRGFFSALRAERIKGGVTGVTVNRDFVAVAAFLRWCQEERELEVPSILFPRERESEGRGRWLTADELADLYAVLKELAPEWVLPIRVLAETGLRLGELLPVQPRDGKSGSPGLRWKNVKFSESVITVSAARVETTKRHARRVDADVELLRTLAEHRETVPHRPEDLVFPNPWTYQIAERIFAKAVEKLEWEHTIVHDLRRTFIVHALSAGVQVPVVQRAVGHRTPAMTIRYARLCPDVSAGGIAAAVAASQRAGQAGREAQAARALVRVAR